MQKYLLTSIAYLLCFDADAQGTAPGLDPTFGNKGIATTESYTGGLFKSVRDLKALPDGKLVIVGNFIARYKSDGTPDSSFGKTGFIAPSFFTGAPDDPTLPSATSILIGDGGKIVVTLTTPNVLAPLGKIVQILPDGTVDTTFGENGIVNFCCGSDMSVRQPDGKIVVTGQVNEDTLYTSRFLPNGSIDSNFGSNGIVKTETGRFRGAPRGISLLSDGRIVVAGIGYDHDKNDQRSIFLTRFLPTGMPDTSLSKTGKIYPLVFDYCRRFLALENGSMFFAVAGLTGNSQIIKLNEQALPDSNFGSTGILEIPSGILLGNFTVTQSGQILGVGMKDGDFVILRLKNNGNGLDTTFGQKGIIQTDITGYDRDKLDFVDIQKDLRIVAAGDARIDAVHTPRIYMIRYLESGRLDVENKSKIGNTPISIYPNPATSKLNIKSVEPRMIKNITLLDALGRTYLKLNSCSLPLDIDVKAFPNGQYFLKIQISRSEQMTLPVIIQK